MCLCECFVSINVHELINMSEAIKLFDIIASKRSCLNALGNHWDTSPWKHHDCLFGRILRSAFVLELAPPHSYILQDTIIPPYRYMSKPIAMFYSPALGASECLSWSISAFTPAT